MDEKGIHKISGIFFKQIQITVFPASEPESRKLYQITCCHPEVSQDLLYSTGEISRMDEEGIDKIPGIFLFNTGANDGEFLFQLKIENEKGFLLNQRFRKPCEPTVGSIPKIVGTI